jgi:hypothetical protein
MHKNPDYAISKKWSQEYNIPLYTHPAKTLTDDAIRYRWLRKEFGAGRETYLAESIPSGEWLDKYIDEQIRKAQEK